MPAGHPLYNEAANQANPGGTVTAAFLGGLITHDALSGPKASPFDSRKINYAAGTPLGWDATTHIPLTVNDPLNVSSGALSTGIGFGSPPVIGPISHPDYSNAGYGIHSAGFTDDYKPGISTPTPGDSADSRYMYIGGGKSAIVDGTGHGAGPTGNGYPVGWFHSEPVPYTAGFGIAAMGNGATRDQAAGIGRPMKMVTSVAGTALNVAVETGWTNNSTGAILSDQSVFGVSTTGFATPALDEEIVLDEEDEIVEEEVEEEGVLRRVARSVKKATRHK
jgi:hypothetical protein